MYTFVSLLAFTIYLPFIVGCLRLRKVAPSYYPILLVFLLAVLHETISHIIILRGQTNTTLFNAYTILEMPLILLQFKIWNNSRVMKQLLTVFMIVFPAVNLTSILLPQPYDQMINPGIRTTFAFIIVVCAVNVLNTEVLNRANLLTSSLALFSGGMLIFYTYLILVEIFIAYGITDSILLANNIWHVFAFIIAFTNIIFAYAILWIPSKPRFLLQS